MKTKKKVKVKNLEEKEDEDLLINTSRCSNRNSLTKSNKSKKANFNKTNKLKSSNIEAVLVKLNLKETSAYKSTTNLQIKNEFEKSIDRETKDSSEKIEGNNNESTVTRNKVISRLEKLENRGQKVKTFYGCKVIPLNLERCNSLTIFESVIKNKKTLNLVPIVTTNLFESEAISTEDSKNEISLSPSNQKEENENISIKMNIAALNKQEKILV